MIMDFRTLLRRQSWPGVSVHQAWPAEPVGVLKLASESLSAAFFSQQPGDVPTASA
jgi:hypothetical protein